MFQSVFRASMLRERGCLERVETVCSDPGFEGYTRYRVLLDTGSQTLSHLGRYFSLEEMFQSVFGASMQRERGCLGCVQTVCSCLLYTSPSPRDLSTSRMPSSA